MLHKCAPYVMIYKHDTAYWFEWACVVNYSASGNTTSGKHDFRENKTYIITYHSNEVCGNLRHNNSYCVIHTSLDPL